MDAYSTLKEEAGGESRRRVVNDEPPPILAGLGSHPDPASRRRGRQGAGSESSRRSPFHCNTFCSPAYATGPIPSLMKAHW